MANHRRFRLRQIEWRTLTKRIRFRQEMRPDLRWYQVFSYLVSLARLFFWFVSSVLFCRQRSLLAAATFFSSRFERNSFLFRNELQSNRNSNLSIKKIMASYLVSMKTNVVRLFFEDPLFTEFYRDFVSIPFPEWDCLREFKFRILRI